jgi:hypothetical protein
MSTYFKDENDNSSFGNSKGIFNTISIYWNAINDKIQFYKKERWTVIGVLGFIYLLRLIMTGGEHFYKIII